MDIYTDGSCLKNPGGRGGWAVVTDTGVEMYGGELSSTNNRMELQAVTEAVIYLLNNNIKDVTIYTDSQYVCKGVMEWMDGWFMKNRLSPKSKNPVKNPEMWSLMRQLKNNAIVNGTPFTVKWIRGHSGIPLNERADVLANLGAVSC